MTLEERVGGMKRLTHRYTDGEAWASIYKVRACGEHECKGPIIDRLAAYEDINLMPEEIMILCSMDRRAKMAELLRMEENKPLIPDDLLKMDGTPVWITKMDGSGGVWMLVDAEYELCRETHGEMAVFENCGKTWLAYRRKPEEGAE